MSSVKGDEFSFSVFVVSTNKLGRSRSGSNYFPGFAMHLDDGSDGDRVIRLRRSENLGFGVFRFLAFPRHATTQNAVVKGVAVLVQSAS